MAKRIRPRQGSGAGKVLVVAKGFTPTPGGVERYSEHVARAYVARGFSVVVMTQTETAPRIEHRNYPEGDVLVENVGTGSQLTVAWRMFWRLRALNRTGGWTLTHATTWRTGALLLLMNIGAPKVISAHGREILHVPTPLVPLMRAVLSNADLVLCVSGVAQQAVRSWYPRRGVKPRTQVSYNGLSRASWGASAQRTYDSDVGTLRILTVCRLVERKNVQGALRALAMLDQQGTPFHYDVVGTGPAEDELRLLALELDLADKVTFHGYVDDAALESLYQRANIFLHPQIATDGGRDLEGFGITIADAMAHGVPVVVGEAGGPGEFITHEQTGLIVDGRSAPAITDAISRLGKPKLRSELGAAGMSWVAKNLSWDAHIDPVIEALVGEGSV